MSQQLDVVKRARLRVAERITDLIGDTPIVRLHKFERDTPGVELWAKCEFLNPGGSVKDRAAYQMIRDAIRAGTLKPGQTIIDSTSGNTGVAYALIGGALGYPVTLVMPGNVSWARRKITEAFGTTLVFSDPMEGSDGSIRLCRKMVDENPGHYFYPDQYSNQSNPLGALQHDRARDLGADRRARHPLRDRHRHHGHGDGHRAAAQGVPARHRGLGGRAVGRAARPRGAQAHGELARPRHLSPGRARRGARDGHRRGLGRLRTAGQGRGPAGRPLVGRVAGRRAAHRASSWWRPARRASSSRSSPTEPSATSRRRSRRSSRRPSRPRRPRRLRHERDGETPPPHPIVARRGAGRDVRARPPRLPERVLRHRLRPQGAATADRAVACVNIQNDLHAQDPATHERDAPHRVQPGRRRSLQAGARACAATRRRRSSTTRTSTSAPTSATPIRPPR